jgi:hypothetical protein
MMKHLVAVVAAATSMLVVNVSNAEDPHGHDTAAAPAPKTQPRPTNDAQFGEHMKQMQAIHERMMAAKTPEERQKAMEDARKAMQDSMRRWANSA